MKTVLGMLSLILSGVMLVGCCCLPLPYVDTQGSSVEEPIHVAVYSDQGTMKRCVDQSVKAINDTPGMDVRKISSSDIQKGDLKYYDVLLLPGGSANDEGKSLGPKGRAAVTQFVKNGKGIIGTCAGAYLLSKGWNETTRDIELVNAEVNDLDHWARGVQTVECQVNNSLQSKSGTTFKIYFENGPPLIPANDPKMPKYVSLATYITDLHAKEAPAGKMGGADAIVAARFGKGNVLLFSPHPELTPGLEPLLINGIRWASKPASKTGPIHWETVFGPYIQLN